MFGLQFKKWDAGWALAAEQGARLRRFAHVIGYCLPRPGDLAPHNTLYGFYFVNPARVAAGSSRLVLSRPGELRMLGVTPDDLASDVQKRLNFSLALHDFDRKHSLGSSRSATEENHKLRKLFLSAQDVAREALMELASEATIGAATDWGQSLVGTRDSETVSIVPFLCWGDFFEAIKDGSTVVTVPGDPEKPPGPDEPPSQGNIAAGPGVGLTITCPGAWGSRWARSQIDAHVAHWARTEGLKNAE